MLKQFQILGEKIARPTTLSTDDENDADDDDDDNGDDDGISNSNPSQNWGFVRTSFYVEVNNFLQRDTYETIFKVNSLKQGDDEVYFMALLENVLLKASLELPFLYPTQITSQSGYEGLESISLELPKTTTVVVTPVVDRANCLLSVKSSLGINHPSNHKLILFSLTPLLFDNQMIANEHTENKTKE